MRRPGPVCVFSAGASVRRRRAMRDCACSFTTRKARRRVSRRVRRACRPRRPASHHPPSAQAARNG
ncbi:hypothetical protein WS64_14660 [Burkholderia anthina]|uniref:Uncharacterized protein n=1 Tax=Burkholderia anthina TaxID=179879 RepID=A0AAW3Q5N4_9BURK|nr:hypothetical protein WS64_14660 [Burkholderia anthina]